MWTVVYLLLKSAFFAFLLSFFCFCARAFMTGFKQGLEEAHASKPLAIDSLSNRRLRRTLAAEKAKAESPAVPEELLIDVEEYYEEQLRIESIPALTIFRGDESWRQRR